MLVLLIIFTALTGVYFAKLEGLNTMRSGFSQMIKNEIPAYEMISGAAIAFGALLLIIPGFATDTLGFLIIFPLYWGVSLFLKMSRCPNANETLSQQELFNLN